MILRGKLLDVGVLPKINNV